MYACVSIKQRYSSEPPLQTCTAPTRHTLQLCSVIVVAAHPCSPVVQPSTCISLQVLSVCVTACNQSALLRSKQPLTLARQGQQLQHQRQAAAHVSNCTFDSPGHSVNDVHEFHQLLGWHCWTPCQQNVHCTFLPAYLTHLVGQRRPGGALGGCPLASRQGHTPTPHTFHHARR